MIAPYYADNLVTLYHGDMREVLPALDLQFDAAIVDPPYGETSLAWDRWPTGWPALVAQHTSRLWCFGTLGMFMEHAAEFVDWKRPRSIVWEKHNGSGFGDDFFKVVHELGGYFYRGPWANAHEPAPRERYHGPAKNVPKRGQTPHTGEIGQGSYQETGTRLVRSVIRTRSMHGYAIHPTEKHPGILAPLIEYAVPRGGLVLDPCAGSCSTGLVARMLGRRAICIEGYEPYAEAAANRLSIPDLFGGAA